MQTTIANADLDETARMLFRMTRTLERKAHLPANVAYTRDELVARCIEINSAATSGEILAAAATAESPAALAAVISAIE